ncbi:probable G-protein coupled receptor 139 [Scyliorhinus canicula]|uniref:probable G-protein coupled receptor 139 n=1 Tax=Scyliorhinus canicula TaxID=7830 RepID=UPI0018F47E91|nr:probable G-protein coupled receptor 139 [Scyliorhinus canicula]
MHQSQPVEQKPTIPLEVRILKSLYKIQKVYYPFLAVAGIYFNVVAILILSRGKCGLSKCITRYLLAMASSDLLVVILDLILRQLPVLFYISFVTSIKACNIHAILLYAATDCSVWFTVTFTFDRFVVISCPKLKSKYCNEKIAAVVIGTVSVLSCLKNVIWYFLYTSQYRLFNDPWFCIVKTNVRYSLVWRIIELAHYVSTPCIPFVLVLLFNVLTVKKIFAASIARQRLRLQQSREKENDPEMQNRKKSIVLMFVISGNFIAFWALFLTYSVYYQSIWLTNGSVGQHYIVRELGFMLQLLNCCTNTFIYAITQSKFRAQLKDMVKCPLIAFVRLFVKFGLYLEKLII